MLFTCLHRGHSITSSSWSTSSSLGSAARSLILPSGCFLSGCFSNMLLFSHPYDAYVLQYQGHFNFTTLSLSLCSSSAFLPHVVSLPESGWSSAPAVSRTSRIPPHINMATAVPVICMERISFHICQLQRRLSSNTVHFHPVNHTRLAMRARHIAQREYDGVTLSCSHPRELRVLRIFFRCGLHWCTLDVVRDFRFHTTPSTFQLIRFLV
ncbi:unnamed protein product [Trypanosoma congolense IL3000]|uniref:WGS project CAEQ00000000 data, annotated contig 1868 n=1 Tax=Trypanosoma congolense (strain IL3000) TaxID=1068625 RepID=F9W9I4_TRYCI|nr:unnamed protein product [Trypanosoma congolense IL3000]